MGGSDASGSAILLAAGPGGTLGVAAAVGGLDAGARGTGGGGDDDPKSNVPRIDVIRRLINALRMSSNRFSAIATACCRRTDSKTTTTTSGRLTRNLTSLQSATANAHSIAA